MFCGPFQLISFDVSSLITCLMQLMGRLRLSFLLLGLLRGERVSTGLPSTFRIAGSFGRGAFRSRTFAISLAVSKVNSTENKLYLFYIHPPVP